MRWLKMGDGLVMIFLFFTGCATTGSMKDPLIEAVESGNLDEVKLQLKMSYGGARHIRDKNGKTLLHLACEYGHANIVRYLLANGMNPDTTDRIGDTALQIAAYNGYADIIELFIVRGRRQCQYGQHLRHYPAA